MAEVRWTPQAADDLGAIAGFIAGDSPHYAKARGAELMSNRLSCLPIVALVSLACAATRQEIAPRLPSSLLEAHGAQKAERIREAIAGMMDGVAENIGAIREKYHELREWGDRKPVARENGGSLRYHFRRRVQSQGVKTGFLGYGDYGCLVEISAWFVADPRLAQRRPDHWFPGLKVGVGTTVGVGDMSSDGFVEEIHRIFEKHLELLRELDRESREGQGSTTTLSVPGSAAY